MCFVGLTGKSSPNKGLPWEKSQGDFFVCARKEMLANPANPCYYEVNASYLGLGRLATHTAWIGVE